MALAIFDLDNTLLAGDSDHRWGEFLCEIGWVSAEDYRRKNDQFYADYEAGSLNMTAYLDFVLGPLAGKSRVDVQNGGAPLCRVSSGTRLILVGLRRGPRVPLNLEI